MAAENDARNEPEARKPGVRDPDEPALTEDMAETLGNRAGRREPAERRDEIESETDDPEQVYATDDPASQES